MFKYVLLVAKNLRRNVLRTLLTALGTMVLVLVITVIWSVLHLLDGLMEEKQSNLKAIATERPEWDLVIVGRGELQPGLEQQSGEFVRQGRIRFLGHQDTERVAAIYRGSHVLVLASNREAWALVVNEACCAGMAIVVSTAIVTIMV